MTSGGPGILASTTLLLSTRTKKRVGIMKKGVSLGDNINWGNKKKGTIKQKFQGLVSKKAEVKKGRVKISNI